MHKHLSILLLASLGVLFVPPPAAAAATATYHAAFFNNRSLRDAPVLVREDPEINFAWGYGSPGPGVNADYFSARWTKALALAQGDYQFTVTADDGVRFYLDNALLIDKWIDQGPTTYTVIKTLTAGDHTLKIEYYEHWVGATMKFSFAGTSPVSPPPPPPANVLVAAGDIAKTPTNAEPTAKLLDAIPGTVATLGDNAYETGTLEEFNLYYEPTWGRHKARTRPAIGNHEMFSGGTGYYAYFGAAAGRGGLGYYSYDIGAWRIIVLNSEIAYDENSAQVAWLKSDLAANPRACTLAYWHRPRFSSGATHGSDASLKPFWNALYAAGADVVLSGHAHDYERFAPQTPDGVFDPSGIREFVIGTGGAELQDFGAAQPNSEVRDNSTSGVLKLTLNDSSFDWQFVPVAAPAFTDTGSANCVSRPATPPPPPPAGNFQASFFNNRSLSGAPVLVREDPEINFSWGLGSPGPGVNADYFSARWTKTANFASGDYQFTVTADDGVRFYLDNVPLIDKWIDQGPTTYTVTRTLTGGQHALKIEFYEHWVGATMKFKIN